MRELREAVGLRKLVAQTTRTNTSDSSKLEKVAKPSFKQYRETDGRFHFKLLSAEGKLLLHSDGFTNPKEAALAIASLQQLGCAALDAMQGKLLSVTDVNPDELALALQHFIDVKT